MKNWHWASKLLLGILVLLIILILAVVAIGPRRIMGFFHAPVTETPAPTTIPLPTPTPTDAATVTTPPEPTAIPVTVTATATTSPDVTPTRVIPPDDAVSLPPDFGISVFAEGLSGPRMMALGPDGHVYVAERGANRVVRLPDRDGDGIADGVEVVADGLNRPSSIDFHPDGSLYVGETTRILRLRPEDDGFGSPEVVIAGLPSGGHNTRTVLLSPDGETLFVSVGSSCNVCIEDDARRATVVRYNPDGSGEEIYATGLRNAVGITFHPNTGELWATNNGRDWLGDDQPPETVNLVREGDDFGWPRCHAGRIVDPDFGSPDACDGVADPEVEMQAHSAPLGLAFYTGELFPNPYQGDLFVAFHGSWNRTEPTGYKVVRIPMEDGAPGPVEDFAAGWLREDGTNWGRPVDVITGPDGSLLISDDSAGFIYRVFHTGRR